MPTEKELLSQKVQSTFQQLAKAAADLNSVSDDMGKCVGDLDAALKKLNLGVTQWVEIHTSENPQTGDYTVESLGYAKVGGKWGIALGKSSGNQNYGPDDDGEEWLFNEGPRELRLAAIQKIPELLNKLSEAATKMTARVRSRLEEAQAVAEAVKTLADEKQKSPAPSKQSGGQK